VWGKESASDDRDAASLKKAEPGTFKRGANWPSKKSNIGKTWGKGRWKEMREKRCRVRIIWASYRDAIQRGRK